MDSHRYRIRIDDLPIDLARIANSGQMFRLFNFNGVWHMNDGDHVYQIVEKGPNDFAVESNQENQAFQNLFRLETNHAEMHQLLTQRGPEIEPFLAQRRGLRMLRPNCRTEVLFSFLCSSCNHITRITSMVRSLSQFADSGFPSIERLSEITEDQLRSRGFGYRGATIPKVAQILHLGGGEQYLDDLAQGTYSDARHELIALPGVGKKLADCICLYAFDFGEAVPVDTHIWQVLTRLYHPEWVGTSLTDKKYETVAEAFRDRFGKLAGAAHQFLFVDNMERYRERDKP